MEQTPARNVSSRPVKIFSCLRCYNRRVKCDKEQPCGGCLKSNAECVFRERPPPRRRKARTQEEALLERLKRYEVLLDQSGIDPNSTIKDPQHGAPKIATTPSNASATEASEHQSPSSTSGPERAYTESKLLYEQSRSKFVDKYVILIRRRDTADDTEVICGLA